MVGKPGPEVPTPKPLVKDSMSTKSPQSKRSTVRDKHIVVGVDGRGAHHCYDTQTETVHIVHSDGSRGRKILGRHSINDYIDAVSESYGWESQRLFKTMADFATDRVKL